MAHALETVHLFIAINAVLWAAVNGVAVRVLRARTGSYSAALGRTLRSPVFHTLVVYLALCLVAGVWATPGMLSLAGLVVLAISASWGFYTASRYVPPEMP